MEISFNPRPRTGGDRQVRVHPARITRFQSTPPHGGRHHFFCVYEQPALVSIHAPARGATHFL